MTLSLVSRWGERGFWAVTDQGLFAVSNFVLNMLLARWLIRSEYGAFSLTYTVFLLLGTLHTGVLTEPMLVFGSGKYNQRFREYLEAVLLGHWRFSVVGSVLLVAVAFIVSWAGSRPVALAIGAFAFASPFLLLQWIGRRACYVNLAPRLAACAGVPYMGVMLISLYVLYQTQLLSPVSATFAMAGSSLASAAWLLRQLKVDCRGTSIARAFAREVTEEHWRYGRWAASSEMLTWVRDHLYYVILPVWGGLEATATLRALMNLIMPIKHTYRALAVLTTAFLVRLREGRNFKRSVTWGVVAFVGGAVLYWLLLGLFHEKLLTAAYGGRYTENGWVLWIVGLIPVAGAGGSILSPALRALERPDKVLFAYGLSTVAALTAGIALIASLGVPGATVGFILSSATGTFAMLVLVHFLTGKTGSVRQLRLAKRT